MAFYRRANADSSSVPVTPVHIEKRKKKKKEGKKRLQKRGVAEPEGADDNDDVQILPSQMPIQPNKHLKSSCSLCGAECEGSMCTTCEKVMVESEKLDVPRVDGPKMVVANRELQLGAMRNLQGVHTVAMPMAEEDGGFILSAR